MNQVKVGCFQLGHEYVDLYALPEESGGYFYLCPEKGFPPRIKVGLDHSHWDFCISVLLHETFEFLMARLHYRYAKTGVEGDHASYLFQFDHCQFSDLCQRQATFLAEALPALAKVWGAHHTKKKKKR